jgi:hypothetical protein
MSYGQGSIIEGSAQITVGRVPDVVLVPALLVGSRADGRAVGIKALGVSRHANVDRSSYRNIGYFPSSDGSVQSVDPWFG